MDGVSLRPLRLPLKWVVHSDRISHESCTDPVKNKLNVQNPRLTGLRDYRTIHRLYEGKLLNHLDVLCSRFIGIVFTQSKWSMKMYWDSNTAKMLYQERLDEAENARLANQIRKAQREANDGYNPTLAWVGQRMIDLGSKLVQVARDPQPSYN